MARDSATTSKSAAAVEHYPWHDGLRTALSHQFDKLPHALLLQGRPGLGKHDFAIRLAQALLCEQPRDATACGKCRACHLFQAGTHPDFHVLQPEEITESNGNLCSVYGTRYPNDRKRARPSADITIYQIRSLIEDMQIRPYSASRKVVLLSPAEAMNLNAANSLLKLLEEPPLGSMLLLVTGHPARLPATIRSRCARLLFRPPPPAVAEAWLQSRPETREHAARLLDLSGGAPLLAATLAREEFPRIRTQLLQDLAALAQSREHPVACAARWKGFGTARVIGWLHGFANDLIKLGMGAAESALLNPEAVTFEGNRKNKYKISELYVFIDAILEKYRQLNSPLDELLILEDVLIRWIRLSRLQSN
ncbi:MAG: DNA polymerase III subunit delta' [Gammaproteobacteria bacterium]|nr:DNA polymerase III subunit delta' [Gammaproteobacteria bacterium]MDH5512197.1 DNA polymerase III subunit delta' [Gammaproteobacteria bacterium]